jgi:hypothetical protein
MSGRIGGTIEQMQTMGAKFTNEATELEALVSRISAQLAPARSTTARTR